MIFIINLEHFHFSKMQKQEIININHAIYFKNDLTFEFHNQQKFLLTKTDISTLREKCSYLNQTFHKKIYSLLDL